MITRIYIARYTIEFITPFLVGSGKEDSFLDNLFVTDANGLPCIPGTSIAGVIRHEMKNRNSSNSIFGSSKEERETKGSRLTISFGVIHNSKNIPVEGLVDPKEIQKDPILYNAHIASIRDHVRINHRGTAKETGKFDDELVPAGHRFTIEFVLKGSESDKEEWNSLNSIMQDGSIRLGGKTTRGLGAFKVISYKQRVLELPNELDDFLNLPSRFSTKENSLKEVPFVSKISSSTFITANLQLKPLGFWMFGGGNDTKEADMVPVKEDIIEWKNNMGSVTSNLILVPASSVKGAIAHRVAFYYNSLTNQFADEGIENYSPDANKAIQELFGYTDDTNKSKKAKGIVYINDLFLVEQKTKVVPHVSIDRFTGGARRGALFSEKPNFKGNSFLLSINIQKKQLDSTIKKALELALLDLAEGNLSLGAGVNRGNGTFKAEKGIEWSDKGEWIHG